MAALLSTVSITGPAEAEVTSHAADADAWHRGRIERLTGPTGWLSLVGLAWLEEGTRVVGSAPKSDVLLPAGAPAKLATLEVKQGKVTLTPARGAQLKANGAAVAGALELVSDANEATPTMLESGTLSFFLIERGGKLAVRIKDSAAKTRTDFHGIERFAFAEGWRIESRFVPYASEKKIPVPNVLGQVEEMVAPGEVVFTVQGKEHRLQPVLESADAKELFFIFGDESNKKDTYGAGRFLYSALPVDGKVVVDFNKAYNPPCAFTPYATCPLPPRENKLPFRIEAGEKRYGDH